MMWPALAMREASWVALKVTTGTFPIVRQSLLHSVKVNNRTSYQTFTHNIATKLLWIVLRLLMPLLEVGSANEHTQEPMFYVRLYACSGFLCAE